MNAQVISVDDQISKIFEKSNTTNRYFIINEDGSLTRLPANKIENGLIDKNLSSGRTKFDIINGLFLTVDRNLRLLLEVNVHRIDLENNDPTCLAKKSYYKPSNNQFKRFLKAAFNSYLYFYIEEKVAIKYKTLRKMRFYDIDRQIEESDAHDEPRSAINIINNVTDVNSDKYKMGTYENMYSLLVREKEHGLPVNDNLFNKLQRITAQ